MNLIAQLNPGVELGIWEAEAQTKDSGLMLPKMIKIYYNENFETSIISLSFHEQLE